MKLEEHKKVSKILFGEGGEVYHKWIDTYASLFGYYHRDIFHHKEGIEIGVQIFGECCRKHLEQHIKDDRMTDTIPTIQELRDEETELTKRLKERKNEYRENNEE